MWCVSGLFSGFDAIDPIPRPVSSDSHGLIRRVGEYYRIYTYGGAEGEIAGFCLFAFFIVVSRVYF